MSLELLLGRSQVLLSSCFLYLPAPSPQTHTPAAWLGPCRKRTPYSILQPQSHHSHVPWLPSDMPMHQIPFPIPRHTCLRMTDCCPQWQALKCRIVPTRVRPLSANALQAPSQLSLGVSNLQMGPSHSRCNLALCPWVTFPDSLGRLFLQQHTASCGPLTFHQGCSHDISELPLKIPRP